MLTLFKFRFIAFCWGEPCTSERAEVIVHHTAIDIQIQKIVYYMANSRLNLKNNREVNRVL